MADVMPRALSGVRVAEWGRGRASAYAGKLLGDFGAEVVLIERDHAERLAAFDVGPVTERACQNEALERFLHGGKRSVRLDPALTEERSRLLELLAGVDVLILQLPVDELEALGLAPETIAEQLPHLILVPITLAGLGSDARHLRYADLVAHAIGGTAIGTPARVPSIEEHPPLKHGGYQAEYTSGLTAAVTALLGLQYRRRTGKGQLIDVSSQAVLASYVRMDIAYRTYGGGDALNIAGPRLSPTGRASVLWGLVPCKDGYYAFQASEQYQWEGLMRAMGDPEWSRDPRFQDPTDRVTYWDEIEPHFVGWSLEHTKAEIFHAGQAQHVPVFPCYTVAELIEDPQQVARGYFVELPLSGGPHLVKVPGALIHLEKTPWRHDPKPPAVGDRGSRHVGARHASPLRSREVTAPNPTNAATTETSQTPTAYSLLPTAPLSGVRVADFSWVVAGPFCTQFLALMGAEVIRIESSVHTDINRRLPPAADGLMGIERSGLWHGLNLNKKSVTLNLKDPEAQALVLEIVRRCDVAIENFSYGQLEKLNLGYEQLKAVKPDLIMVTSSGLGRSGPFQSYVTFGPPMTAYTGLASITGQDGGEPERWLGGLWSDHQAGLTSLFGLLLALEHRDRTGEGQLVEYSMSETITAQIPEALIQFGCEATVPGPIGNRDRDRCPHGVYRAAGDDRWVAIAVQSDDEWRRFREIVPGPSWWRDPALENLEGRLAREAEINAVITAWTRQRGATEAAHLLQDAQIAAGAVATIEDLLDDPILRARGFFVEQDHPEVGKRTLAGIGWTMPCMAGGGMEVRHAPLLGEHNWEIFVDWLGMTPERFGELVGAGAIV